MTTPSLDTGYDIAAQVSVRPESFGALLYHFGTRRLSFLKDPVLLAVVQQLPLQPTVRDALMAADVAEADQPRYLRSLGTLVATEMLVPRPTALQEMS